MLTSPGGWMQDMQDVESPDRSDQGSPSVAAAGADQQQRECEGGLQARQEQLCRLRELCIPEIVSLLHKVYIETERYSECARLAELIQSDKYSLYQVFYTTRFNVANFIQCHTTTNTAIQPGKPSGVRKLLCGHFKEMLSQVKLQKYLSHLLSIH